MAHRSSIQALLGLVIAFLVLGGTNHCAFEELFASAAPHHHSADGDHHGHQHHGHGQPHEVVAVKIDKGTSSLLKLLFVAAGLAFAALLSFCLPPLGKQPALVRAQNAIDPPGTSRRLINALDCAPQAPPCCA